jgi:hypothetical protein
MVFETESIFWLLKSRINDPLYLQQGISRGVEEEDSLIKISAFLTDTQICMTNTRSLEFPWKTANKRVHALFKLIIAHPNDTYIISAGAFSSSEESEYL